MVDPRARLGEAFSADPHLVGTLDQVWEEVRRTFPGETLERWIGACREVSGADLGPACIMAYMRSAPTCATVVGPEAAVALGGACVAVGRAAGRRAALALLSAATKATRRLDRAEPFCAWLDIVTRLAPLAPESIAALLDRIETLLAELDVPAFESWALAGVRAAGGEPDRRVAYFSLADRRAWLWLHRDAADIVFADVERRLKAYLVALWRLRVPIRTPGGNGAADTVPHRASFDNGLIRVPETFRGVAAWQATELFRAALAHIGAHLLHSGARFPVGSLKPVQVALVSLIEDARVETLAMREYPGLRRLWRPFHVARPSGALIAPALMARLARALIDPAYEDDNAWVRKGRALFFDAEDAWDDPATSRRLGGLLGNDLGQMRVQFNARTYVVEPPYRDDNLGLWDFGDAGDSAPQEPDTLFESARIVAADDEASLPDRERNDDDDTTDTVRPPAAADEPVEEAGVPVARYPEWDYVIGRVRPQWTTVVECPANEGRAHDIDRILDRHPGLIYRISALIRSARVSRPVRLRRQPEGDRLDIDACIEAAVSRRRRETPDPRVYATSVRRHRDLSVLLLLDASQSTNDVVLGGIASVLSLERDATALLAHAMDGLGDPFAVHAFCSNGREEVRYTRIKDFGATYDAGVKSRLAGLTGSLSTRIGAALRHAGGELGVQSSHRRLLLVVTDGEPSDIDVADRRYLVEDARQAVAGLAHAGIDVFAVGLDSGGDSYLARIFGPRNVLVIDRLERLPERLPMLYFRLTA
ncbi:MAG: nitric oxide reductase activation protein NorD [Alphaproteobacteria bacterium]